MERLVSPDRGQAKRLARGTGSGKRDGDYVFRCRHMNLGVPVRFAPNRTM
jgi:hypothetical protein